MASTETQLLGMGCDDPKLINGITVLRYGDCYMIEDKEYTLDGATKKISKNKIRGFPYNSVAFLLVKPPSKVLGHFQIKNKKEHKDLLKKAITKKALVYYTDVFIKDGKYVASQPWVVDFDSVDSLFGSVHHYKPESNIKEVKPDKYDPVITTAEVCAEEELTPPTDEKSQQTEMPDIFKCPFCNKEFKSTPGRTLHVKSKHPESYAEYIKDKN